MDDCTSNNRDELCAVSSLIQLSTDVKSPPTAFDEVKVTPERASTHAVATYTTPTRRFTMVERKRERDDLVTIVYTTGDQTMAIPFARGEKPEVFFARRNKAARLLFDESRHDVYCSWRLAVVNMSVKDPRWIMYKDTLHQKRYKCGAIQLVITRFTCCQWKEGNLCRNCQNRGWRTACLSPHHMYFVLPNVSLSAVDFQLCDGTLSDFEAIAVERDIRPWTSRMPQLNTR